MKLGCKCALAAASAVIFSLASSVSAQTVTFGTGPNTVFTGSAAEAPIQYSLIFGNLVRNTRGSPGDDLEGQLVTGGTGGVVSFTSSAGLFTFLGLDFAAYRSDGTGSQILSVTGYRNGALVAGDQFSLSNTNILGQSGYSNWTIFSSQNLFSTDLDELRIVLNASAASFSYEAVDNVRFGAAVTGVPESETWATMILGMGAVGYKMRQRRKAASRVSAI